MGSRTAYWWHVVERESPIIAAGVFAVEEDSETEIAELKIC